MGGPVFVGFLQNEERLLLFALIGDQAFAVEAILNARELPHGRPKIHQDPWAQASKLWNFRQHGQLMPEDAGLVLFGPPRRSAAPCKPAFASPPNSLTMSGF